MTRFPARLTAAFAALGAAATVSIATAPAAQAMGCNVAHRNVSGLIAMPVAPSSPVRRGPAEGCGVEMRTSAFYWQSFHKDCWVKNDVGNIWWYGFTSVDGGGYQYGWMWDGNFTRSGNQVEARYRCF